MKKKIFAVLALAILLALSMAPAAWAENIDSGATAMPKLSQDEIKQLLLDASTIEYEEADLYEEMPSCNAPYVAGSLKSEPLQVTLNRLNALRRIAGLPAVALDPQLTELTQHGAVVIAHNNILTHRPTKPEDMDDSFFSKAYTATRQSNIAAGISLTSSPDGFMDDSDITNIDRVRHRRWQLNPDMGKTGFGYIKPYTVEFSFDESASGFDYDYIAWPASGNFPNDIYAWDAESAWSVTLNPSKYRTPSLDEVVVTLRRESDNTTWTFSGSDYTPSRLGEYYNIDTSFIGIDNCIIFRPVVDQERYIGDYSVEITGLHYKDGSDTTLLYTVNFFNSMPIEVRSVSLDKKDINLNIGDTNTLVPSIYPNDATNQKITWESDNENIATVDNNGKVTAVGSGRTVITVTTDDGNKTARCFVTVNNNTDIKIVPEIITLQISETFGLNAIITPESVANQTIDWTSIDENVATVDGTGKVTAIAVGTTKIIATVGDGSKIATCTVTVTNKENPKPGNISVTGVTLNETALNLAIGDNAALTATVAPDNATNKKVTFTSSNDKIVTVDANGKVTAIAAGSATITATTEDGGKTATCTVTVTEKKILVESVTLDKTALTLEVKTAEQLNAAVLPADATNKTVAWTTSDDKVAAVDKDGKVTAVGKGTAVITATAGDKKTECTVTVTADKVYTITFDTNGGTLATGVSNPDYVTRGEGYKMPTATRSSYTLQHWAIGAKDSQTIAKANETYTFTADTTVYAVWQYNNNNHNHSNHGPNNKTDKTEEPTKPETTEKPGTTTTKPSGTVTALNINNVFADVKNGEWYSEAVAYVYNKGMMNGTEKGFEPNAATTRAMLVSMLYRLEGEPATGNANFSDVADGQWFSKAIAWASSNGVVNGYENGMFGPNDAITREQLAAVLYRYAQAKGLDVSAKGSLTNFSDSSKVSGWAAEAMQWAVGAGIINGDDAQLVPSDARGAGALKPQGNATRAEVAMMIMRFSENIK